MLHGDIGCRNDTSKSCRGHRIIAYLLRYSQKNILRQSEERDVEVSAILRYPEVMPVVNVFLCLENMNEIKTVSQGSLQ